MINGGNIIVIYDEAENSCAITFDCSPDTENRLITSYKRPCNYIAASGA